MNIIKILILTGLLFFTTCSEERIGIIESANVSYFPMQVGNKWVYESSSLDMTVEITGLIIHNIYAYYEFIKTYDGEVDTVLCRASQYEKVFIFFGNSDELLIDFQRAEGETWQSFDHFYAKVNRRGLSVQTTAGNFENVIEIFSDNTQSSDLYEFNRYAPEVGLVETIGFRRMFKLKRAYVNGVNYP